MMGWVYHVCESRAGQQVLDGGVYILAFYVSILNKLCLVSGYEGSNCTAVSAS